MTTPPRERRLSAALAVLALSLSPALADPAPAEVPGKESGSRVRELRALAAKGPQSAPSLVAALKDPSASVRAAAVQLLASVKKRPAVADIAPLVSDPDEIVAVAAVGALFDLGGEATLAPLRRALASPSERVRKETASYAGVARDARLVPELGALLSDE
ncbi:MAG TPA: HEAT repeat domain-containing protein, partial [Candidatus Polarisedimenticolaceae bacterium]|nr:HEAT repeat domain-containing protein [Candidatus Polarisedimenticolaceae bacterium]